MQRNRVLCLDHVSLDCSETLFPQSMEPSLGRPRGRLREAKLLTVRSKLPDTSHLPSGLQLTEYTSSVWPFSTSRPIVSRREGLYCEPLRRQYPVLLPGLEADTE